MVELFAKAKLPYNYRCRYRSVFIDDEIVSLSAILLNDTYYQLLIENTCKVADLAILCAFCLILFKAKAWLDLNHRRNLGQTIKSGDLRKHKYDVARLTTLLLDDAKYSIPQNIHNDLHEFINSFKLDPPDMKSLGFEGITSEDIVELLIKAYST